jgi:asparagine synthetase B (glutamine-hydrolysing)
MRFEIDRAVTAAIRSDSPVVAAQLSGGHDSTMVVEAASRLIGADKALLAITGAGSGPLADLPDNAFSDEQVAVETAATFQNVRHIIAAAGAESPLAAIDRWRDLDQPDLNPYNLGWLDRTYDEAVKAGANVMLVGSSGNLTVSWVGLDRLNMLARSLQWGSLLREIKAHRRRHNASWAGLAAIAAGPWVPARLWLALARMRGRNVRRFDERAFLRVKDRRVRSAVRNGRRLGVMTSAAPPRIFGSLFRLRELQWTDFGAFNHCVRARHGVELRDPFAARRVLELSLRLGAEHFYRDGEGRRLSKSLLAGRVPEAVYADIPKRGMQGANWLAGALEALPEMRQEVELMAADPDLSALFDIDALRRHLDAWPAGDWADVEQGNTYRGFLTNAICAGRWARRVREKDCTGVLQ